jgi:hypothetical protein
MIISKEIKQERHYSTKHRKQPKIKAKWVQTWLKFAHRMQEPYDL